MYEDLLKKIYWAKDANEVHEIVSNNEFLSNPDNWKPYGGNKNNFGTFENQQANSVAALVEKLTNSIDAILIKECLILGLNPKDIKNPNLPNNMQEAISNFFNIKYGKWENANQKLRREIAENVQLIVDGDKINPNITIYDNGEGQNPENFEDTFLSLQRGNKTDIPFVQGKYNMGSTGAVVFCGGHRYQLIISKRNTKLKDSNNKIGFTLVRRHILSDQEEKQMKSTWYEYFVIGDTIPSFEFESIDLGLFRRDFEEGSVIKMYSYELPRGLQTDATWDLWRELNTLLYEASVPILIYEKRFVKSHSQSKLMLGNKTRIQNDENDKKQHIISYAITNNELIGENVPIEVAIFKPDVSNKEFIRQKSIIFTLNGQTQGYETRTFITQELGYRALRESMLINIDCTNMRTRFRQDLFMASRDRMKQGNNYATLKQEIIDILKNDDNLRRINQEYKSRVLHESKEDKELIEKLFSNLKGNKEIKNILKSNNGEFAFLKKKVNQKKEVNNKKEETKKILNRFPSYFKVEGLHSDGNGKIVKAIPLGGKGSIVFGTDVENEYFARNIEKGDLTITLLDFDEQNN